MATVDRNQRKRYTMKRSLAFTLAVIISLMGGLLFISVQIVSANPKNPQELTPVGPSQPQGTQSAIEEAVHVLYFYANDCPHCIEIIDETLLPLKEEHGDLLDLRLLEISIPEYYEAMLKIETYFEIPSAQRSIPTLVIDNEILIGETPIRDSFAQRVYPRGV